MGIKIGLWILKKEKQKKRNKSFVIAAKSTLPPLSLFLNLNKYCAKPYLHQTGKEVFLTKTDKKGNVDIEE